MEHQVIFHKNDDEDEKYNGYIEIKIIFHNLKINWLLTDCGCYPSSEWIELLNCMNGTLKNKSPAVGGGENSSWSADATETNFRLCFDISGCGGDSIITYEFPVDEMIPVVEQIIEKIKLME